jgi:hypothetical protein
LFNKRRNGAGSFSEPAPVHAVADRFHSPGCFVPQLRGQFRRNQILAHAKHNFRAVEADGLHAEPHLAGTGLRQWHFIKLEDSGAPRLMKTNNLYIRHGFFDEKRGVSDAVVYLFSRVNK